MRDRWQRPEGPRQPQGEGGEEMDPRDGGRRGVREDGLLLDGRGKEAGRQPDAGQVLSQEGVWLSHLQ